MTIKQQGGIFGRNPSFNSIEANSLEADTASVSGNFTVDTNTLFVDAVNNRVGVGLTPTEKFDVDGNVRVRGASPRFKFLETDNDTKTWQWGLGGGNMLLVDDLAGTIPFRVNQGAPNNSLLVASDGNVSVANNLAFASGKGIDFSATSGTGTSELFDDYEEGTWTPTDASGAGLSFSAAVGSYTKVGRMVFATGQVQYPVTSNTANSKIGGLPFSTISGNARGAGSVNYKQTANVATLNIDPSTTTFGFYTETGSGTDNNLISNTVVYFGMVYTTS